MENLEYCKSCCFYRDEQQPQDVYRDPKWFDRAIYYNLCNNAQLFPDKRWPLEISDSLIRRCKLQGMKRTFDPYKNE